MGGYGPVGGRLGLSAGGGVWSRGWLQDLTIPRRKSKTLPGGRGLWDAAGASSCGADCAACGADCASARAAPSTFHSPWGRGRPSQAVPAVARAHARRDQPERALGTVRGAPLARIRVRRPSAHACPVSAWLMPSCTTGGGLARHSLQRIRLSIRLQPSLQWPRPCSSTARLGRQVRGELVQRAAAIKEEMAAGSANVPFKKVLECNIGNPQAPPRQASYISPASPLVSLISPVYLSCISPISPSARRRWAHPPKP